MGDLQRIRVEWSGWNGGPGISTFYAQMGALPDLGKLEAFFTAIRSYVPQGIVVKVHHSGDLIDEATGALVGTWQSGTDQTIGMTGTGSYSAASGAQVTWNTDTIHGSHHLRGRTFLVPLVVGVYGTTGLIDSTNAQTIQTAAAAMVNNPSTPFMVWGRPLPANSKRGAQPGQGAPITSASVPTKVVVLRSRRD